MSEQGHDALSATAAQVHLAHAWQLKGEMERAIAGYRRALQRSPDYVPAHLALGRALLLEGRTPEAFECFEQALALQPDDPDVQAHHTFLRGVLLKGARQNDATDGPCTYADHPDGKIDLRSQVHFHCHRSGFNLAIDALRPLHNSGGVLFDGFVEDNFTWKHWKDGVRPAAVLERYRAQGLLDVLATSEERGIVPYATPWVGCLHNPPAMPAWFQYQQSPQTIFAKDVWKRSLDSCLGLFAFSEYFARWLREQTGKPVSALLFPTEIPERQFDFELFMANPAKKVVQIGWWLRRLNAVYQLPIVRDNPLRYEKVRLVPHFADGADEYLKRLMATERAMDGLTIDEKSAANTREVHHLPNAEYDKWLSENIAFLHLYDASANNAVVECIARATPVLVNPIPAVVEYLGTDYPLYFLTLEEAAQKALDTGLIRDAHQYLRCCETRKKLSPEHFLRSFVESEVYRSI